MEPVRVAVIGCGSHSTRAIFPNLQRAGLKLVATCDLVSERAEANARQFGAEASYTDYTELLRRDDLQAVLVCGHPEQMHCRIGIDVMRAGFPCYTEKPPSRSAAQSREAWEVSGETGKMLMCAFKKRYTESYTKLKELIESGELGEDVTLNVNYQKGQRDNFETDSMVHIIDLIRFLMGDAAAVTAHRVGSGNRVGYLILFRFASGHRGIAEVSARRSWAVPTERVEATGEKGFACVDNVIDFRRWEGDGIAEWTVPNFSTQGPLVSGLEAELAHFAECVRNGTPARSDAYNSFRTMELVEAVRESGGREVEVPKSQ